jgi:hypothetical protein
VIERHANEAEKLSASSKQDLIAFLDSLTDRAVTTDPRFAKP